MSMNNRLSVALEDFKKEVIKAAKGKWNRKYDKNNHRIYTVAGAYVNYNMRMDYNRWYEDSRKYYEEYCRRMQDNYILHYPHYHIGDKVGNNQHLGNCAEQHACNIAFMYSLYESCKLNDLNFFDYINDVLTRLMKGETDYKSLIPCNYKPFPEDNGEGQKEVA